MNSRRRPIDGRIYLWERTVRAAHHGLDARSLLVAAPRLPPVVARAIRLAPRGPIHGPRNPCDRSLRSRGGAARGGGPWIRGYPPIPSLRPPRRLLGRSKATTIRVDAFRAGARHHDRGGRGAR